MMPIAARIITITIESITVSAIEGMPMGSQKQENKFFQESQP